MGWTTSLLHGKVPKKDSSKTQEVTKNLYPNIIAKCAYDNENVIDTRPA